MIWHILEFATYGVWGGSIFAVFLYSIILIPKFVHLKGFLLLIVYLFVPVIIAGIFMIISVRIRDSILEKVISRQYSNGADWGKQRKHAIILLVVATILCFVGYNGGRDWDDSNDYVIYEWVEEGLYSDLDHEISVDMKYVDSTAIKRVGYSRKHELLVIEFYSQDEMYIYHNVPRGVHKELIEAFSMGEYYNKHIKGEYACDKA